MNTIQIPWPYVLFPRFAVELNGSYLATGYSPEEAVENFKRIWNIL